MVNKVEGGLGSLRRQTPCSLTDPGPSRKSWQTGGLGTCFTRQAGSPRGGPRAVPGAGGVGWGSRAAVGRGPVCRFFLTPGSAPPGLALDGGWRWNQAGRWLSDEEGKVKGERWREEARAASCFAKLKIDFSTGLPETERAPRGPHLTSRAPGLGAAATWPPAAANSEQRCAAAPRADLCGFGELCFSCLLHQVSSYPDDAPGR